MPRNGSGVYSHPFPDVVEGTTIESAVFNGNTSDVEQDLNTPRPIVAGGTGANNAHDAMIALKGEIAGQAVDNYATFPFADGCFYSIPGATDAPDGATSSNYFWGIAYGVAGLGGCSLEARNISGGGSPKYYREKVSGVWSAWRREAGSVADLDAAYVNVAGDTMTGNLTITGGGGSALFLESPTSGPHDIYGRTGGQARWLMRLGDGSAETGGNAGSDFALWGYNDAANAVTAQMNMTRATGNVSFNGNLSVGNTSITSGSGTTTGNYFFGNSGGKYLQYDGASFNLVGGHLIGSNDVRANVDLICGANTGGGVVRFGNNSSKYLYYDGTNFSLNGGNLGVNGQISTASNIIGARLLATNDMQTYNGGGAAGTVFFGSAASQFLTYNGSEFTISAALNGTGKITCSQMYLNTTNYAVTDNTNYLIRTGGAFYVQNAAGSAQIASFGAYSSTLGQGGTVNSPMGLYLSGGSGTGGGGDLLYMKNGAVQWHMGQYSAIFGGANLSNDLIWYNQAVGNAMQLNYADNSLSHFGAAAYKPGGGPWTATSDARIKTVKGGYLSGLDAVTSLEPVIFTYNGNDTSEPPSLAAGDESKVPPAVPYANSPHAIVAKSGKEFIGLIAQAVEAVMPEMVIKSAGYIDGEAVTDLRNLDTTPLIFALINAVKELKARVEELEAA